MNSWQICDFEFMTRMVLPVTLFVTLAIAVQAQNLAGDEALSKVLMEGEDWQLVAEGLGFTDAACSDADGNFYFFDLGKGTGIKRITPEGSMSTFIENTPKCSGLKF